MNKPTFESIDPPSLTVILRAYNGRITASRLLSSSGIVETTERELVDSEISYAQPLLSVIGAETADG